MRIIYVISGLGRVSGVATFVIESASALRLLGHRIDVMTKGQDLSEFDEEIDVVHIHGLWDPWLHRMSVDARKRGASVVWSTHGMTAPWSMNHKWWKKCLPWYLYQKWDLRRAKAVHCTVEREAEWNNALGFANTFIVPLGTHLPQIQTINRQSPTPRTLRVLFVGRVYPVKGLLNVVRAATELKDIPIKFRIVGPDQAGHMAELMSECDRLGVAYSSPTTNRQSPTTFTFAGPKFDDELAAEYDACDVLILPSHTENFGATVIDALSHCKPALASTNTPWRELEEKCCGWWVDNSVESLVKTFRAIASKSREELLEMGKRGRMLVEQKYTWQAVAKKLEWCYEQYCCKCEQAPCPKRENFGDTCPI